MEHPSFLIISALSAIGKFNHSYYYNFAILGEYKIFIIIILKLLILLVILIMEQGESQLQEAHDEDQP
jgi:hypothetical protein